MERDHVVKDQYSLQETQEECETNQSKSVKDLGSNDIMNTWGLFEPSGFSQSSNNDRFLPKQTEDTTSNNLEIDDLKLENFL